MYSWSLSVSAVNAWRLRQTLTGRKEPFLDFLRELVIGLLTTHGSPPLLTKRLTTPVSDKRLEKEFTQVVLFLYFLWQFLII